MYSTSTYGLRPARNTSQADLTQTSIGPPLDALVIDSRVLPPLTKMIGRRLATIATVVCASSVSAFAPAQQHSSSRIASTELNIFGGLKDAFSNDDSLGKVQNAGLTGGPKVNENVSINGKPVNAVVGQKVSQVAVSFGFRSHVYDSMLFCTLFCSRILTLVHGS